MQARVTVVLDRIFNGILRCKLDFLVPNVCYLLCPNNVSKTLFFSGEICYFIKEWILCFPVIFYNLLF